MPQRNQAQFQVAMTRYQTFAGAQALPLIQSFYGNNTAYRVYATAEQPQVKAQAEIMLDQPILFRDENGSAQMTINALMIDPLPKERPYARVGNPGKQKKQRLLVAILSILVLLIVCVIIVIPGAGKPTDKTDTQKIAVVSTRDITTNAVIPT